MRVASLTLKPPSDAAKGRAPKSADQAVVAPPAMVPPRSASFRAATYRGDFGECGYRLYLPASAAASGKPSPLIVMLHGCGQTPEDFAKGTRMNQLAEKMGVIVLYPAQSRQAHPNRCWNWFRPENQMRGAGEPALLAGLTQEIVLCHPVDPARVYVAGLSAGGSAALLLAHAYPDIFAAVGCHSGLAAGSATDRTTAVMAMKQGNPGRRLAAQVPTIIFHGSEDHVVAPRNGRFLAIRAVETFSGLRATEVTRKVADGRSFVRTSHRIGQGRSWVEHWLIKGAGHAWSGGSRTGRFVDPAGPDASHEMVRFFLRHTLSLRKRTPAKG